MKLFVDSANIPSIKRYLDIGIIDGVTTNPSLLAKEGVDPAQQVERIVRLVPGPVNVEVLATDYKRMLEEGRRIAKIAKNVVVKAPMTQDGLRVVRNLSASGIRTNVTLVFSAPQALLAAKAGASYVSPFIGRLDDIGENGIGLVGDIVTIFRNYNIEAKVIVASVRHPMHVVEAAKIGADIATVPPDVIEKMFMHPLTDAGLKRFIDDWNTLKKSFRDIAPYRR